MMMRSITLQALVLALACWGGASEANAERFVFLVSVHNLNFAKTACDTVLSDEPNSVGAVDCKRAPDTRALGRALEDQLMDALAVNTNCAGITVTRDPHPEYDSGVPSTNYIIKKQKPYWDLFADYVPGQKIFNWTLFSNKSGGEGPPESVNGGGTLAQAATDICTVVNGRGAKIQRFN